MTSVYLAFLLMEIVMALITKSKSGGKEKIKVEVSTETLTQIKGLFDIAFLLKNRRILSLQMTKTLKPIRRK